MVRRVRFPDMPLRLTNSTLYATIYMPANWGQLTRLIQGDDIYGYF